MKLDTPTINYIVNILRVCKVLDIDSVIIEPGKIRGMHPDKTVALIHADNVPALPFGSIGLSRLADLQSRLDIASSQEGFFVDVVVKPETAYAFSLTIKAKGTKIDYRCADPIRIEAKRTLNDVMQSKVTLNENVVTMLQKGISAMHAAKVTLLSNSEGVSFELVDVSNDVFKYAFPEPVESLVGETDVKFAHKYNAKLLLSVIKDNPTGTFEVGAGGALKILVSGLTVYLAPLG